MNDIIPIAIFVGCLLVTLGFVRVCEWLRPASQLERDEQAHSRVPMTRNTENAQ